MNNPFLSRRLLNTHLQQETCQQVLFAALNKADRDSVPPHPSFAATVTQLQQLKPLYGPSIYFLHPAEVERIFYGVTLDVYQAIERLYVDRLGRSISTVTRIMDALAVQATVPNLDPTATWAIALHLDRLHDDEVEVSFGFTERGWQIAAIHPSARLVGSDGVVTVPSIAVVFESETLQVLSYRLMKHSDDIAAYALALYEAFAAQRTPAQDGAAGLRWNVPQRIEVVGEASNEVLAVCQSLKLELSTNASRHALLADIESAWQPAQAALYTPRQFILMFDTYLSKQHGYGPRREAQRRRREYAGLIGYNRDPAWQMPALQMLLPSYKGVINAHGEVECEGLHYAADLLSLFPHKPVTLHLSLHNEATAWLYLDREILCEAKAQELRRKDGTYRDRRPPGSSRLSE